MRVPVGTVAHYLGELHYLGATGRGFAWSDEDGVLVLAKPTSRRLPQDGTWLELVRWCLVGNRNGGSRQWAKVVRNLKAEEPQVTTVVSYSDPSVGHTGALYKACNWTWAPTWHRLQPPPTGNGSWRQGKKQAVKDRWVYAIKPDPQRNELLRVDDHYAEILAQGQNAVQFKWLIRDVQRVLTPDLLRPGYRNGSHPFAGHCYAASEAIFWELGGLDAGHSLMQVNHEGVSHWFVRLANGMVIDPTADQFQTPVPYDQARRNNGFVRQHGVSKRAREILDRMLTAESVEVLKAWAK